MPPCDHAFELTGPHLLGVYETSFALHRVIANVLSGGLSMDPAVSKSTRPELVRGVD